MKISPLKIFLQIYLDLVISFKFLQGHSLSYAIHDDIKMKFERNASTYTIRLLRINFGKNVKKAYGSTNFCFSLIFFGKNWPHGCVAAF